MFFERWASLGRTALVGLLAYAALAFFIRMQGHAHLSEMIAFDLGVTVTIGSTLASVIVSRQTPLASELRALALLLLLQFVVPWLSLRLRCFRGLVKSEP